MSIIFDYQNSESKRELIKPGEYEGEITSARLGLSANGNDMLVVGVQPEGSSTSIRDHIVFSAKAKWKVRQFFDCFDLAPEDGEDGTKMEIDDEFINDLVGKTGLIRVGVESYNGIKRNRIVEYLPFEDEENEGEDENDE
jgi:hypothetical protein